MILEKIRFLISSFIVIAAGAVLGYVIGYISYVILYADMLSQAKTETSYLLKLLLDVELKDSKETYTVFGVLSGIVTSIFFIITQQLKKP